MSQVLYVLIPLALLAVVAVLAMGLYSFTRTGAEHRARSNRLMQWRIALQFIAVALILLMVLFLQSGL